MPRPREHLAANLESLYREAYERARADDDRAAMARLDFGFRRDQLYLEAILDVRDLLSGIQHRPSAPDEGKKGDRSVVDEINELRGLARFPFGR